MRTTKKSKIIGNKGLKKQPVDKTSRTKVPSKITQQKSTNWLRNIMTTSTTKTDKQTNEKIRKYSE